MLFRNKEDDQQLIAVSNFTELITRYYQASCLVVFAYQKAVHRGSEEGFIQVLLCLLQLDLGIINLLKWKSKYIEFDIFDGTQWSIEIVKDGRKLKKYGDNKFPEEWDNFCRLIRKVSDKDFSIYSISLFGNKCSYGIIVK